MLSLPSRECGLKWCFNEPISFPCSASLPSRECVLKFLYRYIATIPPIVTPFAGVWIEISICRIISLASLSLPSRECGLKSADLPIRSGCPSVTPFAGVWIEIRPVLCISTAILSLPSRECGLKFKREGGYLDLAQSLPSRECGLKFFFIACCKYLRIVTPFAGVWIEIAYLSLLYLI